MKENKYDNPQFFTQYSQMTRSISGLAGAGEWHIFRKLFPNVKNKRVLDLGCGFGWHCQYVAEQGAESVLGIDLSEKMLLQAKQKNNYPNVSYQRMAIEDIDFPNHSFDLVISSLAFHYVQSFPAICEKIKHLLVAGGDFVFSVEHPIFTAYGNQDWIYNEQGEILHWPIDNYFFEGKRQSNFLGEQVTKYHKTLTTYVNSLLEMGFQLTALIEPEPDPKLLAKYPDYKEELRRPMFLLISAKNSQ